MTKEKFLWLALILFGLSAIVLVFNYFYFHYSGDNGLIGKEFHKVTKKPFVSNLIGIFGATLLTSSVVCLVIGLLY